MKKNVLVIVSNYLPGYKSGGPIRTISSIVDLCGEEIKFNIVTTDRDSGDTEPYPDIEKNKWNNVGKGQVFYVPSKYLTLSKIKSLISLLDPSEIYVNSFFNPKFSLYPVLINAIFFKKKIILAPRGEFSPGALKLKQLKKKVFILIFFLLRLHRSVVWQATNNEEKELISRIFGERITIKVAHNLSTPGFFTEPFPSKKDELKIVFLSRVSAKKNLSGALKSLLKVRQPVCLDVYGPASRLEDKNYLEQCRKFSTSLPSNVRVHFKGHLPNNEVCRTLGKYDLFFLPTLGENFGHAILEALAAGLPILIADTTPWNGLAEKGVGWELSPHDYDGFAEKIDYLANMPFSEHNQMRQRALSYAQSHVSSDKAVHETFALFDFVKR